MQKYIKSEKGGTLMIAFGFIVVLAIMIAPLVLQTNNGLLQAKTGGNKEIAFTQAHSAYSVFGRLYENLQTKTNKNIRRKMLKQSTILWLTWLNSNLDPEK